MESDEIEEYLGRVDDDWDAVDDHHIERHFEFEDFRDALEFVYDVGELAEEEGHHPDIFLEYGAAEVKFWTHKIDGLHEADFVMAAKVDEIRKEYA
jgi:4a-hydroxytetrahydrobiopterin dehydratase